MELLRQVIFAYNVNIMQSTEETQGNWRGLPAALYSELLKTHTANFVMQTRPTKAQCLGKAKMKGTICNYFPFTSRQEPAQTITKAFRRRESVGSTTGTAQRLQSPESHSDSFRKRKGREALIKFVFPRQLIGRRWRT